MVESLIDLAEKQGGITLFFYFYCMEKLSTQKLKNIPETMLITLWARGVETDQKHPILTDTFSTEALKHIDYDFSRFEGATLSQVGCAVRAKVLDDEAKAFLEEHPDAVVIQLGAGLDPRYSRLGKPDVTHWYDLDLPESIEIRRKLWEETQKNTFLAMSLFDDAWIDTVLAHNKPVLIILE